LNTRTAQIGIASLAENFSNEQPFGRAGTDVAQQLRQGALQGMRHLKQDQDGHIARAIFQIGQMAFGHISRQSHSFAGHAFARSKVADTLAQRHEEWAAQRLQ